MRDKKSKKRLLNKNDQNHHEILKKSKKENFWVNFFEFIHFGKYRSLYITYFLLVFLYILIEIDPVKKAYYYLDYFTGHIDSNCTFSEYSIKEDPSKECSSDEFALNIFSSFFIDLLFFGILGVSGIVLAERKPEDHELKERINFVANAKNISRTSKEFLIHSLKPALVYNTNLKVCIRIKKYSSIHNALYVNVNYQHSMVNMCKDVAYTSSYNPFRVDSRFHIDGDYGMVTKLVLEGAKNIKKEEFIDGIPIKLKEKINGNFSFERNFEYLIPENNHVYSIFSFSHWIDLTDEIDNPEHWYYITSYKFTDDIYFRVESDIPEFVDKEITVLTPGQNFDSNQEEKKVIKILPSKKDHSHSPIKNIHLQPNRKIKIFFKKETFFS